MDSVAQVVISYVGKFYPANNFLSSTMKILFRLLLLTVLMGGLGYAVYRIPDLLCGSEADSNASAIHKVQRRTIEDRVAKRGTVESQNTVYGKCELPGWQNKINYSRRDDRRKKEM